MNGSSQTLLWEQDGLKYVKLEAVGIVGKGKTYDDAVEDAQQQAVSFQETEIRINSELDVIFSTALNARIPYSKLLSLFKAKKDILSSIISLENSETFSGTTEGLSDGAKRFYSLLPLDGTGKSGKYLEEALKNSGFDFNDAKQELFERELIKSNPGRYPGFKRKI